MALATAVGIPMITMLENRTLDSIELFCTSSRNSHNASIEACWVCTNSLVICVSFRIEKQSSQGDSLAMPPLTILVLLLLLLIIQSKSLSFLLLLYP
jgi:hypothetical protein